ncbi:MAG: alkaline phosphatase [Dysgonamonadaceae bacterium]|jgi:predicted AlkP superfamily pyrophosphatase or phosphodiesterase|nr:alkaline phosphatase [Dysgonamonadaceae bacterium]
MKRIYLIISSIIALTAYGSNGNKLSQGIKHVVVIGIDGMSSEGLRKAKTPTMDEMMANGAYNFAVRCVLPTVSKPNWNAMLCGAGPEITGCTGNAWSRNKYEIEPVAKTGNNSFPNIFYLFRKQRPKAELGSIYQWDDFGSMLDKDVLNMNETDSTALLTAQHSAQYIIDKKPDFLFIQLDDVDHAGHSAGHMTEEYLESIAEADTYVKMLLDAIDKAGIASSTLVMVVSDHGGINKGHGGNTLEELTTPIIYYGAGIKKGYEIKQQIYRYDVAADVAFALGLKAPQVWTGRPVKAAFKGFKEPENLWGK